MDVFLFHPPELQPTWYYGNISPHFQHPTSHLHPFLPCFQAWRETKDLSKSQVDVSGIVGILVSAQTFFAKVCESFSNFGIMKV